MGLPLRPWAAAAAWPTEATETEEVASLSASIDETALAPGSGVGVAFPMVSELPSESLFAFLEG